MVVSILLSIVVSVFGAGFLAKGDRGENPFGNIIRFGVYLVLAFITSFSICILFKIYF